MGKSKVVDTKSSEEYDEIELDPEAQKVINWRVEWLRHGGFTKRNATLLASREDCDYRYYNRVLADCKAAGFDEDFVMTRILT